MEIEMEKNAGSEPGLYIVGTPIGNLGDLSPRAQKVLAAVDRVLCEDTRRTSELGAALGIKMKLERFDQHASEGLVRSVVERIQAGQSLALVSDAGTPGISDPAAVAAKAVADAGERVIPIPGPSAVATLISVSGFPESEFSFRGFFPRKNKQKELNAVEAASLSGCRVYVWYESPERIVDTLNVFKKSEKILEVVVAREMTKKFEEFYRGPVDEVLAKIQRKIDEIGKKGEWSFAVRLQKIGEQEKASDPGSLGWEKALGLLIESSVPVSSAVKKVSQTFGVARNSVYEMALSISTRQKDS